MGLASAAGANTVGLHAFSLVNDLGTHADRTIHAIEELLFFPRHTLRTLELSLRNASELPSPTSIRAHSRNLRRLSLDVVSNEAAAGPSSGWDQPSRANAKHKHLEYSQADFKTIIESCSSLVELGVAIPRVSLEYRRFTLDGDAFADCINILAKTLKLNTLSILNWPNNYKHGQGEGYYIAKNLQLARLASDIFECHRQNDSEDEEFSNSERRAALEVVAFGVCERGTNSPDPAYFMQSEVRVLK